MLGTKVPLALCLSLCYFGLSMGEAIVHWIRQFAVYVNCFLIDYDLIFRLQPAIYYVP